MWTGLGVSLQVSWRVPTWQVTPLRKDPERWVLISNGGGGASGGLGLGHPGHVGRLVLGGADPCAALGGPVPARTCRPAGTVFSSGGSAQGGRGDAEPKALHGLGLGNGWCRSLTRFVCEHPLCAARPRAPLGDIQVVPVVKGCPWQRGPLGPEPGPGAPRTRQQVTWQEPRRRCHQPPCSRPGAGLTPWCRPGHRALAPIQVRRTGQDGEWRGEGQGQQPQTPAV